MSPDTNTAFNITALEAAIRESKFSNLNKLASECKNSVTASRSAYRYNREDEYDYIVTRLINCIVVGLNNPQEFDENEMASLLNDLEWHQKRYGSTNIYSGIMSGLKMAWDISAAVLTGAALAVGTVGITYVLGVGYNNLIDTYMNFVDSLHVSNDVVYLAFIITAVSAGPAFAMGLVLTGLGYVSHLASTNYVKGVDAVMPFITSSLPIALPFTLGLTAMAAVSWAGISALKMFEDTKVNSPLAKSMQRFFDAVKTEKNKVAPQADAQQQNMEHKAAPVFKVN